MGIRFFLCKHCGNLVGLIQDAGVGMMCCGEKMAELEANTVDASKEKHVPKIIVSEDTVVVKVGSAPHPMTEAHSIQWIYLETEKGGQRKNLHAGGPVEAVFQVIDDVPAAVFAYCNLHGLWKTEL